MAKVLKCNFRNCQEPPIYRFSPRVVTCYEHGELYKSKSRYSTYKLLSSDVVESKRKARVHRCESDGCKEDAVMLGRDDKLYCTTHGITYFERGVLQPKLEAGERALKRIEMSALAIVSSADNSTTKS